MITTSSVSRPWVCLWIPTVPEDGHCWQNRTSENRLQSFWMDSFIRLRPLTVKSRVEIRRLPVTSPRKRPRIWPMSWNLVKCLHRHASCRKTSSDLLSDKNPLIKESFRSSWPWLQSWHSCVSSTDLFRDWLQTVRCLSTSSLRWEFYPRSRRPWRWPELRVSC